MAKELKVFPKLHAMVVDLDAQEAGVRRFIGRQFVQAPLPEGFEHTAKAHDGYQEMKEEAVVIKTERSEFFADYLRSIQVGDLVPADEATAKAAGLKWEAPKPQAAPQSADKK